MSRTWHLADWAYHRYYEMDWACLDLATEGRAVKSGPLQISVLSSRMSFGTRRLNKLTLFLALFDLSLSVFEITVCHIIVLQMESLEVTSICSIVRQMADALLYIHQQNLVHCAVTSHAIQLVSVNSARLSNFEYMIDK